MMKITKENLQQVRTVIFILKKGDKILVEKRSSERKIHPNLTLMPAGKIDDGETCKDTLMRETYEELNIRPQNYKYIGRKTEEHQRWKIKGFYYLITEWTGNIKNSEAEKLIWIDRKHIDILDSEYDKKMAERAFNMV